MLWGVCLAKNATIFKDSSTSPTHIAIHGLDILSHFPQKKNLPPPRAVWIEEVDKSKPWDFFDGATISSSQKSGGGALLTLLDTHFFTLKIDLGKGTNNLAKLMAIIFLITFSIEKGVTSIQIFGDSQLIINWLNKIQKCHNTRLCPFVEEVLNLLDSFEFFSLHHVYRERNKRDDQLSKESLQLDFEQWTVKEFRNGSLLGAESIYFLMN